MQQFKIKHDGFKEIRKAMLIRTIPITLLAMFGGLAIAHFNTAGQQADISVLPTVFPVILIAMTAGIYIGIKRQKEIFESYQLTLDENGITREQHNTSTIVISNSEIREIIKNRNGSFTVKSSSALNAIGIPAQIEDYEKLETLLAEKSQILAKTNAPFFQKFPAVISFLVIGLMAAVYISNNKLIVGLSGTALLIGLGYSLFATQRSKNIDNKSKRIMWWLLLVTASIIGIMYFKLTA